MSSVVLDNLTTLLQQIVEVVSSVQKNNLTASETKHEARIYEYIPRSYLTNIIS